MNSEKIKLLLIIIIAVIVFGTVAFCLYLKYENDNYIPNDYIAILNGGAGKITYSTYIYKMDNGYDNWGFEYINTTNTRMPGMNSKRKIKVTDKGKIIWTGEVHTIAKNNNAYSYVILPNDNKVYSIEEFMEMFVKD